MLLGKQNQVVNFNEVMAQMKDGMAALSQIQNLSRYLTKVIRQNHTDFLADKREHQENNKEFYSFYYPFKVMDDELTKVADLIGYEVDEDLTKDIASDLEYAIEWNKTHKKD